MNTNLMFTKDYKPAQNTQYQILVKPLHDAKRAKTKRENLNFRVVINEFCHKDKESTAKTSLSLKQLFATPNYVGDVRSMWALNIGLK